MRIKAGEIEKTDWWKAQSTKLSSIFKLLKGINIKRSYRSEISKPKKISTTIHPLEPYFERFTKIHWLTDWSSIPLEHLLNRKRNSKNLSNLSEEFR